MKAAAHLLVIGDREPLAWILREQRMAFPVHRGTEARTLAPGDLLLLYTARGCFRNPTRDRGRVIGEATVAGPVETLAEPVSFGDHTYPFVCELTVDRLAPRPSGVELQPLVERLDAFPDPASWSARMRRALVPLPERDVALLRERLAPLLAPRVEALPTYPGASPAPAAA